MGDAPWTVELARRPVLPRLLVVAGCTALEALQEGPVAALGPAAVLAALAVVASLPWSGRALSPGRRLAVEGVLTAVAVGVLAGPGSPFVAVTLVPVTVFGITGRPRRALLTAAATGAAYAVTVVLAALAGRGPDPVGRAALDGLGWAAAVVAFTLLALTGRRARPGQGATDPHYLDAHRLLSELEGVSRQLSLGLDPHTVAAALREDLCAAAGAADGCILVRTPGGRFVSLAGTEPDGLEEPALQRRWAGHRPGGGAAVERRADGTVAWVPLVMDADPVALAVLVGVPAGTAAAAASRLSALAAEAAPRLASALLFDEVRRTATVDERHRLAREIHDGVAQDLASLAYLVDDARADADGPTAERLAEISGRVRGLVNELRLRLFDLRAGVSDSVGLGVAVSEYLQQVGARTGLAVRLTLDEGPRRLPTSVEVEVLRILQEAVTNVRRHARAAQVSVALSVHPPRAALTVDDDGRGLQSGRPDSLGITGMRERAQRIGGRLAVGPGPDGGTRVRLVLEGASARLPAPQAGRMRHDVDGAGPVGAPEDAPERGSA